MPHMYKKPLAARNEILVQTKTKTMPRMNYAWVGKSIQKKSD